MEIETLLGVSSSKGIDFAAIEIAARRKVLRIAAKVIERHFNADMSDHTSSTLTCTCGKLARYMSRRSKSFLTALGTVTLERAYYYCSTCNRGFYPRDKELGISNTSLSPVIIRMVGLTAATVSFQETSELMHELADVTIDTKQVERTAEALGREIAQDERMVVEPTSPCAPTMYLGMDGTGVPMRPEELEGRKGKQADGSSKTREVKLVTVWSAEGRDADGTPVRDVGSVSYSAAIESAACHDTDKDISKFAKRTLREAKRRGFDTAQQQMVLGDGALWIWNLADECFPGAKQIVDRFHAKENLAKVSKSIFGSTSELATQWTEDRYKELDDGKLDDLLNALKIHAKKNNEARRCLGYIDRNRERMKYPEFRAQGLCTSTGVVEAGCRNVIGSRLKRSGMRWTIDGADAIIALRCCKLSGRLQDFWDRRIAA